MQFLKDIDQHWREDPTNTDVSRLRAAVRHEVLPVLRSTGTHVTRRAVELTDHLRQLDRLLQQQIDEAVTRVTIANDPVRLDRVAAGVLEPVVLSGLLRRLLRQAGVGGDRISSHSLAPLARAVRDRKGGLRYFEFAVGVKVEVTRDRVEIHRDRS